MSNFDDSTKKDKSKIEYGKQALKVIDARKRVKALSGDNDWDITQEILQEIVASHTIVNPETIPPVPQLIEELNGLIEKRYKDEPEMREILLKGVPNAPSVRLWMKKKGWNESVWKIIQDTGLFTESKRIQLIDSLHQRGVERDTQAAKIWLQLSGDYQEGINITTDDTLNRFREINQILHSKKNNDED